MLYVHMAAINDEGLDFKIMDMVETKESLLKLLTPIKHSTALGYVRLFIRLLDFRVFFKTLSENPGDVGEPSGLFTPNGLLQWLDSLAEAGMGKGTLISGLQAVAYYGKIFDCDVLTELAFNPVLQRSARTYAERRKREPSRAAPFKKGFVEWLEYMTVDEVASSP